ncbi:MAG: universal stress protein [Thermodesulfobacteriota bacterium]
MQKKILLAVDNTRPSRKALDYSMQLSSDIRELHYVLFYIQPMISLFLQDEARKSSLAMKQLDKIVKKNQEVAEKLLDDYRRQMEEHGVAPERIECITNIRQLGYAKDIIEKAQKEQYDAIVVGRRGISSLQKMYSGSVTTDILEQSQVIPVWMVDGKVPSGEILVAIDGSEASLRAVDHVSFILSHKPDARLTLLHVSNNAGNYCEIDLEEQPNPELEDLVTRSDKACIDQFYPHAMQKFEDAGIPKEQIRIETVPGSRRIGKSIMDFAQKGNYSTVVVGRRGIDKSFFMGSASRYMINKISNGALWVVP